jgi:hypothetical protein
VRSMGHRLGKSVRDSVASFIMGLLPEIKGQVAVLQPATIEEAEKIARTAMTHCCPPPERMTTIAAVSGDALSTFTHTLTQLVEEIRGDVRQRPARGHGGPGSRSTFDRGGPSTPPYGRGRGRILPNNGVSPGHINNTQIMCHRCLLKGHIARVCQTEVKDLPPKNEGVPQ